MYNAKNAKEVEMESQLPKDSIFDGVIVNIKDGVVKDFLPEKARTKWESNLENPAIDCEIEVMIEKEEKKEPVKLSQMFTYNVENNETVYGSGSNLGKFKKKYGKLPEPGDQVKIITNEKGFGKIKLE